MEFGLFHAVYVSSENRTHFCDHSSSIGVKKDAAIAEILIFEVIFAAEIINLPAETEQDDRGSMLGDH